MMGPNDSPSTSTSTTKPVIEDTETSVVCTLCSKKTSQNININEKKELLKQINQLEVEIPPIDDHIDYICYQCVFKLNCIQESKIVWASNIKKSRINYYYRSGDKEMVRQLIASRPSTSRTNVTPISTKTVNLSTVNNNDTVSSKTIIEDSSKQSSIKLVNNSALPETITKISNTLIDMPRRSSSSLVSYDIAGISKTNHDSSITENGFPEKSNNVSIGSIIENGFPEKSSNISISTTQNIQKSQQSSSILPSKTVLNIICETTEPAAVTESGGVISSRKSAKSNTLMKCKFCDRTYRRPIFLLKHERKHERELQKLNPASKTKSVVTTNNSTLYDCPECNASHTTIGKLKVHNKVHEQLLKCTYCQKIFRIKRELDFHEAICLGILEAKESTSNMGDRRSRRIKQMRSRYQEQITEIDSDCDIDSMYTSRLRNTSTWTKNVIELNRRNGAHPEVEENENDDAQSTRTFVTNFTRASSRVISVDDSSSLTGFTVSPNNNKRRKRSLSVYTINSTASSSKRRRVETADSYISSTEYITNDGEIFQTVHCVEEGCPFIHDDLIQVMNHDTMFHNPKFPGYFCKRCKFSFTRELYYMMHADIQAAGDCLCYICGETFKLISQLKEHFEQHKNSNENYHCEFCKLTFISHEKYTTHLQDKEHLRMEKKTTISIHRNDYPILRRQEKTIQAENKTKGHNKEKRNNFLTEKNIEVKLNNYKSINYEHTCECTAKTTQNCFRHRKYIPRLGKSPTFKMGAKYPSCVNVVY